MWRGVFQSESERLRVAPSSLIVVHPVCTSVTQLCGTGLTVNSYRVVHKT